MCNLHLHVYNIYLYVYTNYNRMLLNGLYMNYFQFRIKTQS